jgi:hypothetical protein
MTLIPVFLGDWLEDHAILWFSARFDESAPLASPGDAIRGKMAYTDTGNKLTKAGGKLVCTGVDASLDPRAHLGYDNAGSSDPMALSTGYAGFWSFTPSATNTSIRFGFDGNVNASPSEPYYQAGTSADIDIVSGVAGNVAVYDTSESKYLQVVRSSTHGHYFIKDGKLVWVTETAITTPAYVAFANISQVFTCADIALVALPAPWSDGDWLDGGSELGIADYHNASPSADDTDTSTANAHHQFKYTATASETLEIFIRRTDDTHAWIIRGDQAGSTVKIIEADGSETERASSAQTWTPTTEYDIHIDADDEDITVIVDGVSVDTYGSAASNKTVAGTKVAGFASGAEFNAWPNYPDLPGALK